MTEINAFTKVDLHIHTTASDGSWTPQELVAAAVRENIGIIAVTDHDSVVNVEETQRLAKDAGIICLGGVEVNSTKDGNNIHVLAYGADLRNKNLRELLRHNEALMEADDVKIVAMAAAAGYAADPAEFVDYTYDRRRGGWRSLAYLIDKGVCFDVKDFFKRIYLPENQLSFPIFPAVEEVIAAIHEAGGAAVCAHAASSFHGPGLEALLETLAEESFDGFECYHSCHTAEGMQTLLELCRRRGYFITGGSDSHGSFTADRYLGQPEVRLRDIYLPDIIKS